MFTIVEIRRQYCVHIRFNSVKHGKQFVGKNVNVKPYLHMHGSAVVTTVQVSYIKQLDL